MDISDTQLGALALLNLCPRANGCQVLGDYRPAGVFCLCRQLLVNHVVHVLRETALFSPALSEQSLVELGPHFLKFRSELCCLLYGMETTAGIYRGVDDPQVDAEDLFIFQLWFFLGLTGGGQIGLPGYEEKAAPPSWSGRQGPSPSAAPVGVSLPAPGGPDRYVAIFHMSQHSAVLAYGSARLEFSGRPAVHPVCLSHFGEGAHRHLGTEPASCQDLVVGWTSAFPKRHLPPEVAGRNLLLFPGC